MFLLRVLIQHCCHCRRQSSCLFRLLKKATSIADFCCKSVFAPEQSEKQFLKLKPGDLERAVQLFGIQVQLIFFFFQKIGVWTQNSNVRPLSLSKASINWWIYWNFEHTFENGVEFSQPHWNDCWITRRNWLFNSNGGCYLTPQSKPKHRKFQFVSQLFEMFS